MIMGQWTYYDLEERQIQLVGLARQEMGLRSTPAVILTDFQCQESFLIRSEAVTDLIEVIFEIDDEAHYIEVNMEIHDFDDLPKTDKKTEKIPSISPLPECQNSKNNLREDINENISKLF